MPSAESNANLFLQRKGRHAERSLSRLEWQISELEKRVEQALREEEVGCGSDASGREAPIPPERVEIWGVPFARLTLSGTLRYIGQLIDAGRPGYFITANLNYNMLTAELPELQRVNARAAFIVCDGMPMVWWSRRRPNPLPERVAGSELIYALTKWAAIKGYRVFFLGGAPGVAQAAANKLQCRYPGLQVAGVESPPYRPLTPDEDQALVERIRASRPDIVYVAFGQPKGELWLEQHFEQIGAPISVQIGASFDFVAGGVTRAPVWMQHASLEWLYRLLQEPRRLARRYRDNAWFLWKAIWHDLFPGRRDESQASQR